MNPVARTVNDELLNADSGTFLSVQVVRVMSILYVLCTVVGSVLTLRELRLRPRRGSDTSFASEGIAFILSAVFGLVAVLVWAEKSEPKEAFGDYDAFFGESWFLCVIGTVLNMFIGAEACCWTEGDDYNARPHTHAPGHVAAHHASHASDGRQPQAEPSHGPAANVAHSHSTNDDGRGVAKHHSDTIPSAV